MRHDQDVFDAIRASNGIKQADLVQAVIMSERDVDEACQRLRIAGKIYYDHKTGWHPVTKGRATPPQS